MHMLGYLEQVLFLTGDDAVENLTCNDNITGFSAVQLNKMNHDFVNLKTKNTMHLRKLIMTN